MSKHSKHIPIKPLNEYVGNMGYSSTIGGRSFPMFQYTIRAFNKDLEQKSGMNGNEDFSILIGHKVKGVCAYDNKEHEGVIKSFFKDKGGTEIKYVYIIDQNSQMVPLWPETIKKSFVDLPKKNNNRNQNIRMALFVK